MGRYREHPGLAGGSLLILCGLLLAGCSINPRVDLADISGAATSRTALEVPFFPQTENQCGPAALATVLSASGVNSSPEWLSPQVFLPEREGSLQVELMAATRRAGRIPYLVEPRMDALLAELDQGRPVLLLQNLATPSYPAWHYAVLTGYDRPRNALQLNSGQRRAHWIRAPRLLRTWDWGGRWALVALRPGELPAGDPQETTLTAYFQSLAEFDQISDSSASRQSWLAAAGRWPNRSEPALALGNLAYEDDLLTRAASWYARGLTQQPENPALTNNLASLLGEAGCARRGESLLHPVVVGRPEGDAWTGILRATLKELQQHAGEDSPRCDELAAAALP